MIVNTGLITKLNAELSYLNTLKWGLFTNNYTITAATVYSDLTEASWTGYSTVSGLVFDSPPTIVSAKALSTASPNPSFGNTSGSTQTYYGWFCYDPSDVLVAAVNLGAQTIANGGVYVITPSVSLSEL